MDENTINMYFYSSAPVHDVTQVLKVLGGLGYKLHQLESLQNGTVLVEVKKTPPIESGAKK